MAQPSPAMSAAQAQLIEGITKALAPKFEGLAVEIAELQTTAAETQSLQVRMEERFSRLDTLATRLEALEMMGGKASPPGTKRPPRAERKVGEPSQTARGSAPPGEEDGYEKVMNSMQFCRRKYAEDAAFRTRYVSPETREKLDGDSSVTKFTVGTEERLLAEGRVLWAKFLSKEQKEEVKREFAAFKDERDCTRMREPLGETPLEDDADP